ncbi:Hypothetical protein CINCED_3A002040 [Cinara cedri]|uniref:Aminopeptidase n=1 Tax=Cinara cedri TaxID=506608 RepID=A0A5E4NEI8_9HEMI|nr:Hypothetical protein CINCED_3A002040 [Cinara cedri]
MISYEGLSIGLGARVELNSNLMPISTRCTTVRPNARHCGLVYEQRRRTLIVDAVIIVIIVVVTIDRCGPDSTMVRCVLTVLSWCAVLPWCHRGVSAQSNYPRSLNSGWDTGNGGFANNATGGTMDVFRLPPGITPVSYALEVATDFERMAYAGRVTIVVKPLVTATNRIVLNSKDLRVTGVEIFDHKTAKPVAIKQYYPVDKNEQLVIELSCAGSRCLTQSRLYAVQIAFEAALRNDMTGYYKSSYKHDNVTKWLAITKFEPTFARRAFPCFDEPALKTPFKVSLKRRSDQISLSNMPLANSSKIQGTNTYWDHFQETPPTSTYLVAFFVGEFYAMKTRTFGVYTHSKYISQAEYIADESPRLIEAMENYTGINYMLPKLDLLAIPDFAAGAMENWGLNTYRERLLLVTENSKTKVKEFVTTVVQHELSHQWFGDLVTCAWWDYLWLNEGFATFFEYFATKTVEPDWRLEDVFVYEVHQLALEADQEPTHPISGSVQTPAEIKNFFDNISYSKAGAVLRMLLYTVTEQNFKKALNYYLEDNKYAAATPEDLWTAFENVLFEEEFELGDNITVTEFMESWTEQSGYPLVRVKRENDTFVVTQERFLTELTSETDVSEWIVGLTYTTEDERNFSDVVPKTWLTGNKTVLLNQSDSGWFIFNLQSIGFYRVNYEPDNWDALINQLYNDCNVIHVLNRAQLIDDAFNLAEANQLDYILVLMLSEYLKKENDVIPWYSAKNGFEYLLYRTRRCPHCYKHVKTYVGYLAGLIYAKTEDLVTNHPDGLAAADHSAKTGWNAFSRWACDLGDEHCIKSAMFYFNRWNRGKKIPADIKDAAFCAGVKYGTPIVWNKILGVYVNSDCASDRQSAQLALACSQDPVVLSKYLDFMFDGYDGPIRPQDFRVIYQTLATKPQGISALIEFVTNKLDRIVNEIINGEQVATAIYSLLASRVATDIEIALIDDLRRSPSVPAHLQARFNRSYGAVDENLAWFKTYHGKVGEWAKNTVHKLGLDTEPTTSSTTEVPTTETSDESDETTPSSAGPSNHRSSGYFISRTIIIAPVLLARSVSRFA